jgi:hypothetical protein
METNHTPGAWIGQIVPGGQGLVYAEETGQNIALAYDPKNVALIAAAPAMLKALYRITHPAADESDLEFALQVIDQATEKVC